MKQVEIKKTALKLFNEKGYEGTTMRDISEMVEITAPSIYFHYKSKEELFLEVFGECQMLFANNLQKSIEQNTNKPSNEQLHQIFKSIILFYKSNKEAAIHIIRFTVFPVPELKEKLYSIIDRTTKNQKAQIASIFTDGITKGIIKGCSARQLMISFYTLYMGYIMQLIRFDLSADGDEIDLVWDLYWNGISSKKRLAI